MPLNHLIHPRGNTYIEHITGPKTEPWGTPHENGSKNLPATLLSPFLTRLNAVARLFTCILLTVKPPCWVLGARRTQLKSYCSYRKIFFHNQTAELGAHFWWHIDSVSLQPWCWHLTDRLHKKSLSARCQLFTVRTQPERHPVTIGVSKQELSITVPDVLPAAITVMAFYRIIDNLPCAPWPSTGGETFVWVTQLRGRRLWGQ